MQHVPGLSPTVLLSSAPRQPGTAVQQPAAVAAVAASAASSPSAEKVWHGWTPFQVGTMCETPGFPSSRPYIGLSQQVVFVNFCPNFTVMGCDRGSFIMQRRAVEKGIQMFGWDACHIRRLVGASRSCGEVRQQVNKSSLTS
jgi:hypothetical protein